MIEFRAPRPSDVLYIAKRMADMDRLECAAFGRTPRQALDLAVRGSVMAWTASVDGKPLAAFGVTPVSVMSGVGVPWLLCVPEARRHQRAFLERGRPFVQQMQATFPALQNMVHRDNARAIRWLRRLGFTVEAEPVYAGGHPMLPFWRGRPCAIPSP